MKRLLLLSLFLFAAMVSHAQAYIKNKAECKEFADAKALYVIKDMYSENTYKTSSGEEFTFDQAVRNAWPDKKITVLTIDEYNDLPNVSDKFYITRDAIVTDQLYRVVFMNKGKIHNTSALKAFIILYLDLSQIADNVIAERLIYTVNNLAYMTSHIDIVYSGFFSYQIDGMQKILQKNTLYIREDLLASREKDSLLITDNYPYKFKIVTKEQWTKAFVEKTPGVIVADPYQTGTPSGVWAGATNTLFTIYKVEDGTILAMGWGYNKNFGFYKINKNFYKMFEDHSQ